MNWTWKNWAFAITMTVVAGLCLVMMARSCNEQEMNRLRAEKAEAEIAMLKAEKELAKTKAEPSRMETSESEPEPSGPEIVEIPEEPKLTLIPEDLRQLLLVGLSRWKGMCNSENGGQLKMELTLAKMGISRLGDNAATTAANSVLDFVLADLNKGEYERVKLILGTFELVLSDEATELVEKSYADLPPEVKLLIERFRK